MNNIICRHFCSADLWGIFETHAVTNTIMLYKYDCLTNCIFKDLLIC